MDKIKIQLAIQGGGAKIVALMAVLEALEQVEDRIEVTKIVGTSAGALAGAFFASGVGIKNVVAGWRKGELASLLETLVHPQPSWFLPAKVALARALYRDEPIWKTDGVRAYLSGILVSGSPKVEISTFEKLRQIKNVELYAITTHLQDRSAKESKLTDGLVDALIASAALPYYFRKWDPSGTNSAVVDGGICDNLPTGKILGAAALNEVPVCITFEKVPDKMGQHDFVSFTKALFESAIDYSTEKSLSQFPNTLSIQTTISTFDFVRAIEALKVDAEGTSEYGIIRDQAREWFSKLHAEAMLRQKQRAISESISLLHPWQTENPTAKALMRDIFTAIHSQYGEKLFHFHKAEYRATLDSLRGDSTPDVLSYVMEFEPGDEPLYCYWMGVSDSETGKLTKPSELIVISLSDGAFVPHVRIPVVNPEKPLSRRQAIFFKKPLFPGNRYRLTHVETGTNLLQDLHSKSKDELGFRPNRVLGTIGEARLIVDVPKSVPQECKVIPRVDVKASDIEVSQQDIPGYRSHIVQARQVSGVFALDFFLVR